MQKLLKNWVKHIVAILILLVATVVYFSPSVIDGKVLRQGDNIKATGMGARRGFVNDDYLVVITDICFFYRGCEDCALADTDW